ncbi:2-oxoglutarate dehydrogenase E1 component [Rhizobium favelukesii]|uniref:2-oxoglutarate dehydrogenase E1 component n=1 Tax=Rhizobium favelukesii TaxID=348824 RepID=W6RPC5_9HYPH|nr:2-oxoglutarate dehydrogenase E1 component [Rhizobium favelukesii]MCS0460585.1 2-oxoglutarate dehydrogenase E1 component [Rhizobium favelukesii]CDM62619.1 2-oxoglutarate dehydrogenase E1 component [Rhizobium favelukesii]
MNHAIDRQPANEIFSQTSFLDSVNASYIESLQARYLEDPSSVGAEWRDFFSSLDDDATAVRRTVEGASWKLANWPIPLNGDLVSALDGDWARADKDAYRQGKAGTGAVSESEMLTVNRDTARALTMIRAYRMRGHLHANLDPLGLKAPENDEELNPTSYGFGDDVLNRAVFIDGALGVESATIREIVAALRSAYCGTIGYEYMHISDPVQRGWIQERVEARNTTPELTPDRKRAILKKLVEVTGYERYLNKKFVGTTRFGIDGAETTIVALEEILERGAALGVAEVVFGMAHRGRLNVLSQVIRKPHRALFSEFKGGSFFPDEVEGSGDVKYHLGTSSDREFGGKTVHLSLVANPSHLEIIDPVVLGKVRAKQEQRNDSVERATVLPLLIHGDAAFAGQGVVAESLGLSGLKGYRTGGSVHLIINNQVGFTTDPSYSRSSPYPSDVAKTVEAPIFHVNGDDPEAVARVARLAIEYRQTFHKPVVIDLICFRLFGHNEGDEPSFTQPAMYKEIRSHKSTLEIYAERLILEGLVGKSEIEDASARWSEYLDAELEASKSYKPKKGDWLDGKWAGLGSGKSESDEEPDSPTGVDTTRLRTIGEKITTLPEGFNVHPTVGRFIEARRKTIEAGKGMDWATAEALALGSLADDGYPVRLSGQDSERGTFSQRHSVIIDQETGTRYMPLSSIRPGQAPCETFNSMLSEEAVLAFEYGYSLAEPRALVVWEAQFGDFANGAQVVFDQFLSSAERKWLRMSGLVCLLPHGYDGQGPEHSSARLERYLQSSAEGNWQVANCSTPANYFHVLRRQLTRDFRKPLILMTPKSLQRHKRCKSDLSELDVGARFQRILRDDSEMGGESSTKLVKDAKIRKVLLCSGKVYYDLEEERSKRAINDVYLLRVEQLYPFPARALAAELARFPTASIVWCQEEPKNMGAWSFVEPYVEWALRHARGTLDRPEYVGRPASASTATGQMSRHLAEVGLFMDTAFAP